MTADNTADNNVDPDVARGFGREWSTFRQDQDSLSPQQRQEIFDDYFRIFPWHLLPPDGGIGIDVGCGTGRWSMLVAPRVRHLHVLDASAEALAVAEQNLASAKNVSFHLASVAAMPLPSQSLDFAYSLGVLHHVPDTQAALGAVAGKLKPGAPFLIYLYYALDNRPAWYRLLWRLSNVGRARHLASAAPAAARDQPDRRGAGLLAPGAHGPRAVALGPSAAISAAVLLRRQVVLRDAD